MPQAQREFIMAPLPHHGAPWEAWAVLWHGSGTRCPFQSPAILRRFAQRHTGPSYLVAMGTGDRLSAGAVLKADHTGGLSFLSDLKTDVNRFIFHREATPDDKRSFFSDLLDRILLERRTLTLNSQDGAHADTALLLAIAREKGLYCADLPNSACPRVQATTPDELFALVNANRELRYRVNKLRNQVNAAFEVLTGDDDIDAWAEAFFDTHVRRWDGTPTPSSFRDPVRRAFVKECLHAWAADDLLVRFSVTTDGRRIGFVVGLRAPGTIIHHSTTYDPAYAKYSPGKALILHMAGWMRANGCAVLDFGDGREPYKYIVANAERPLHRIFIARKDRLRFIVSTTMLRMVRTNGLMYGVYQRHIKRRLRA